MPSDATLRTWLAGSCRIGWLSFIVAVLISVVAAGAQPKTKPKTKIPEPVAATVCKECHGYAYEAWRGSHHDWALKKADTDSVLGDFDSAVFDHRGVRSRFFRKGEKYVVSTDGPDGALTEFEVLYAVGVTPLQQYLVALPGGRLQALDTAWDTLKKRWFHLYPDADLKAGNGLHWTGPYKNWNARCAVCHQTDYDKAYTPKSDSYQSRWSELNVSCGACHGLGEAHVAWARSPEAFKRTEWQDVDDKGFRSAKIADPAEREIQTCAPCHSRRGAFGANSPPAGAAFSNHHRLALLRDGLYHADGQIDDEVYVLGSYLQSKMHRRGVSCGNCHDPHSGDLVADGNAVCTQCHNPAGNDAFPTLAKTAYDDRSHHHHEPGTEGAACVSCHMVEKTYMQVDPRRDHSFRVPRPDLSERLGTPNACTGCHADKPARWAREHVEAWFPNGQSGKEHFAETFHAARTAPDAAANDGLMRIAMNKDNAPIVRASALDHMRAPVSASHLNALTGLSNDPSDLVRAAALPRFQRAPRARKIEAAATAVSDPVRAVRQEAARLLIGEPLAVLPANRRRAAGAAITELQRALFANADFPETQMQIAGLAMVMRNVPVADQALRTALRMDPQLADAWLLLARIQSASGKSKAAQKTLTEANRLLPQNYVILMDLATVVSAAGDHKRAVEVLEGGMANVPETPQLLDLLAANHLSLGNVDKARGYAKRLREQFPNHRMRPSVRRLLSSE